jgi:hypothetical protein
MNRSRRRPNEAGAVRLARESKGRFDPRRERIGEELVVVSRRLAVDASTERG